MRAARVVCRTPRDAVMFAVHCTFLAEGYVLLAAGDNVDPMMFQEKEEEPDDGLPKRKPDPHVGWNDMDDEYAFKYCALADYDNSAQAPAPAHVGAILKAIFIGNTLMCHSVRTEDGARAHNPGAPLASLELPMKTHARVVDEVTLAADPTLALADVAALVGVVRTTLVDPVRRRSIPDGESGDGKSGEGVGGVDARGPGARGETGSAAGEGRDGWLARASAGVPTRRARGSTRTARFPAWGGAARVRTPRRVRRGPEVRAGAPGSAGVGQPGCGVWRRARRVLSNRAGRRGRGCPGRARAAGMAGCRGRAEVEPRPRSPAGGMRTVPRETQSTTRVWKKNTFSLGDSVPLGGAHQSFPLSSRTLAYHVGTLRCDVVVNVLPASPPTMSSSFGTLLPSFTTTFPFGSLSPTFGSCPGRCFSASASAF